MEGRNAPLVRQLFALLEKALAIASALQDNDDPVIPDVQASLRAHLDDINRQIDRSAAQRRLRRHQLRGGSWRFHPRDCRPAVRVHDLPVSASSIVGFRVVCRDPAGHIITLERPADDPYMLQIGRAHV